MAPELHENDLASPYEIIFSCNICQKTISEIYREPESDRGFNSSDGIDKERIVTKLWFTQCVHLTCSEHLEGGGVPFHPESESPKAACPVCLKERGDSSLKSIFGVLGHREKEHDPRIPSEYFQTPPEKLDLSSPEMNGLRFQYLALMRFGVMLHGRFATLQVDANRAEMQARKMARSAQEFKDQLKILEEKVTRLEAVEVEYLKYKKREPEIRHYLKSFTGVATENSLLKDQLTFLGYEVPRTEWTMKKAVESEMDKRKENGVEPTVLNDRSRVAKHQSSSSNGLKRAHEQYALDEVANISNASIRRQEVGRQMMPPPQAPRNHSFHARVQPQQYENRSDPVLQQPQPSVQVYGPKGWGPAAVTSRRESPRLSSHSEEQYMMSGALPPPKDKSPPRSESVRQSIQPSRRSLPPQQYRPLSRSMPFLQRLQQPRSPIARHLETNNHGLDARVYAPIMTEAESPYRALPQISRSPLLREPLALRPDPKIHRYPQDLGSYKNTDMHYPAREKQYFDDVRTPARSRHIYEPTTHAPPISSPFFNRHALRTPMHSQNHQIREMQMASGARNARMPPPIVAQSPMRTVGQSLNSLSFVHSPFTGRDKPIPIARPYFRVVADQQQHQPYEHRSHQFTSRQDPASSVHRRGFSATQQQPSRGFSTIHQQQRKIYTRDDDLRLLRTIRGAKTGATAEPIYREQPVYADGRYSVVPFSRSRLVSSGQRIGGMR